MYEWAIIGLLVVAAVGGTGVVFWYWWRESAAIGMRRDHSPNWSPDSSHVIYASERGGKADLFTADRNGGDVQQITNHPADEGGPAYSPDGQWIAFHSDRDGNFEIYKMRPDGSEATRLTTDPAIDQAPCWSPDSQWLVFMSDRSGRGFDIYRMRADGTNIEALTDTGTNWFPEVSPDGGQIAMHVGRDVHILNLSSRLLRRVTREPANGLHPTWSPDGNQIAFMSWRNGRSQIFVARADGTEPQPVVTMPAGDAVDPRWSPDGRFIAFVHAPSGTNTPEAGDPTERLVYVLEIASQRVVRISR
jgi:Tol biopolymer transport system component